MQKAIKNVVQPAQVAATSVNYKYSFTSDIPSEDTESATQTLIKTSNNIQ